LFNAGCRRLSVYCRINLTGKTFGSGAGRGGIGRHGRMSQIIGTITPCALAERAKNSPKNTGHNNFAALKDFIFILLKKFFLARSFIYALFDEIRNERGCFFLQVKRESKINLIRKQCDSVRAPCTLACSSYFRLRSLNKNSQIFVCKKRIAYFFLFH
jgi:hypothetical protein